MNKHIAAGIALAVAAPLSAFAQNSANTSANTPATTSAPQAAEVTRLKQEIQQEMAAIRAAYEARLQALEQRLVAAEAAAQATAAKPAASPAVASAAPATRTATAQGANAFNPAISLIVSGLYGRTSQDPEQYGITGFALPQGAEIGPAGRGFSLAETELGLSAQIDPFWRGAASIALHPDNEVSVEEAYVQTTALGHGLNLKMGRFLSNIGYLNNQHAHTWDFVDNPLAYQALLGTQYGEDGVQLNWLAPTDQYLHFHAELGRGRSFPGGDNARNGAGGFSLGVRTGGDVGVSHNWRLGASILQTKASGQALTAMGAEGESLSTAFSGRSRVWVLDGVWKWAPQGNASVTHFKLQGEYLRSQRTGSMAVDPEGSNSEGHYSATQSGWYVQGIYQFMPRWRVGLRTERLNAGTPDFGANEALLARSTYKPAKHSLMLDYSFSEFSRLRLQLAQDRSREGVSDKQLFLQYQMSLGAHSAHSY